ncbi:MAG: aminoglycoside phosphotransferase family protein [Clostridia bacterium]|nr:aminoglycoside phosphotransferase family protein [Clostridia bacterium]
MYLFDHTIVDLDGWAAVFQNIEAFEPLVRHILGRHGLPQTEIANTTPGSHAVFRAGKYLVKVYAPDCFGWPCESDFLTEIAAMRRANRLGISVPDLVAHGRVYDRYEFRYLIQTFVHGTEFGKTELSADEKVNVGKQLRGICDRMNVPCERFNDYDFIEDAIDDDEWDGFPADFRQSRADYIRNHPHGTPVYVHGDIHADNAILGDDGAIWILDFADSVTAPVEYEYASLFPGLFRLEAPYLNGFFGEWDAETVAEQLTYGFCLHRFGAHIIGDLTDDRSALHNVDDLRNVIRQIILRGGMDV